MVNFAVVSVERGIWARDNAIREAEIALQLRHPNIVTTYARVLPPNQDRSTGPSPLSPLSPREHKDCNAAPTEAAHKTSPSSWQLSLVQVGYCYYCDLCVLLNTILGTWPGSQVPRSSLPVVMGHLGR